MLIIFMDALRVPQRRERSIPLVKLTSGHHPMTTWPLTHSEGQKHLSNNANNSDPGTFSSHLKAQMTNQMPEASVNEINKQRIGIIL